LQLPLYPEPLCEFGLDGFLLVFADLRFWPLAWKAGGHANSTAQD